MWYSRSRIIIFAKAPIPGHCMTRMVPTLSSQAAADLHSQLVRHTLNTTTQAQLCPVELWCAGNPQHIFFKQCQYDFSISLRKQQGEDLGERMAHAFRVTLNMADHVIGIGTDCPALTSTDLEQALAHLNDYDCVLKPAEDGGYVLIGLNSASDAIFQNIHWGSETVLQDTRARIKTIGYRCAELTTSWDVDHPADLDKLDDLPLFQ